jgi:hypothetical protein
MFSSLVMLIVLNSMKMHGMEAVRGCLNRFIRMLLSSMVVAAVFRVGWCKQGFNALLNT